MLPLACGERVTFLCVPKEKSPKEMHPRCRALRFAPSSRVQGGVRLTYVPIRSRTGAHRARPPVGLIRPALAATKGDPRSRANQEHGALGCFASDLSLDLVPLQRTEHRRLRRYSPQGRAQEARAFANVQDVRQANTAEAEKRRAPRSFIARCVVGGGVFLVTFSPLLKKK